MELLSPCHTIFAFLKYQATKFMSGVFLPKETKSCSLNTQQTQARNLTLNVARGEREFRRFEHTSSTVAPNHHAVAEHKARARAQEVARIRKRRRSNLAFLGFVPDRSSSQHSLTAPPAEPVGSEASTTEDNSHERSSISSYDTTFGPLSEMGRLSYGTAPLSKESLGPWQSTDQATTQTTSSVDESRGPEEVLNVKHLFTDPVLSPWGTTSLLPHPRNYSTPSRLASVDKQLAQVDQRLEGLLLDALHLVK